MMLEQTPAFAHPLSAFRTVWEEGAWMRGWLFSCLLHLQDPDSLWRLPTNAVRLRLMVDPEAKLWHAWHDFGNFSCLAGWRAYFWSALPLFLFQLLVLGAGRLVLNRLLGPWEEVSPNCLIRLLRHEDAPLLPYMRALEQTEKEEKKKAQVMIKDAYDQFRKLEGIDKKKSINELNKLDLASLLTHAFNTLDEQKKGSITFRAVIYGKAGPVVKATVSDPTSAPHRPPPPPPGLSPPP